MDRSEDICRPPDEPSNSPHLKGLKEAIAAKEMRPESSRELTEYMKERINNALLELQKGQQTTMVYY